MTALLDASPLAQRLLAAVPDSVAEVGEGLLRLDSTQLLPAVRFLRDDPDTDLVFLANLTAVDRESHFELVYHLRSLDHNHILTLKAHADHDDPVVTSLTPLYTGAHLQERELYDLMGIRFDGHPDLRRIFLWDGFAGHPLRKDFLGMPSQLKAGLPGFPYEPGFNAWPVPGTGPRGGTAPDRARGGTPADHLRGGAPSAGTEIPMPGGAPVIPGGS